MKKINVLAGIRIALVSIIVSYLGFLGLEPMVAKAATDAVIVTLGVTSEVTINSPTDVTLSSIAGMTGGTSTNDTLAWIVSTNDTSGYSLSIVKNHELYISTATANEMFDDYAETTANDPDYTWDEVITGEEKFGFSPYSGTEWKNTFWVSGSDCTAVSSTAILVDHCWIDIPNTGSINIGYSAAQIANSTITLRLKAQAGGSNALKEGSYTTTITATATTN